MAAVRVFESATRSDATPAYDDEPIAKFLDRAAGETWEEIRDLIERWFADLPLEGQSDMRGRLRSPLNQQFLSAFWELFLHASLRAAGFTVKVHPEIRNSDRRPDFLATLAGASFYVEARLVSDGPAAAAKENRERRFQRLINAVPSPNFFLAVDLYSSGETDPSTKKLRRDLVEWLEQLDADRITSLVESGDNLPNWMALPSFEWSELGWNVRFRAIPKKREARGDPAHRAIGIFGPGGAQIVDDVPPLQAALSDKGVAYGDLDGPYIVALSISGFLADNLDVEYALYGREQFRIFGDGSHQQARARDGYWIGHLGWIRRQVSAVLTAHNVSPWTVVQTTPKLWLHPDPEHPLHNPPEIWGTIELQDGVLTNHSSKVPASQLFALPADWPPRPFE